jgi:hypothetical protein
MADEVGQDALGQAQQLVTMDAAVVLETFFDSNRDLGRKAVMGGVDPPASQRYLIVESILRRQATSSSPALESAWKVPGTHD